MSREHQLLERMAEAKEAKELLQDLHIERAFNDVEVTYIKLWAATPADQAERREELYYALNGLRDVRSKFMAVLRDGRIAEMEISDKETRQTQEMIYG